MEVEAEARAWANTEAGATVEAVENMEVDA